MDDWRNGGFGLYVHWPFCQAKCPYCDFNSHVVSQIDQSAWVTAYQSELRRMGELQEEREKYKKVNRQNKKSSEKK